MPPRNYDPEIVGRRIAQRLKDVNLRKGVFAKRLGRNRARVSFWLKGKGLPDDMETWNQMADLLECKVDYLMGRDEATKDEKELTLKLFRELLKSNRPEIQEHLKRQVKLLHELIEKPNVKK